MDDYNKIDTIKKYKKVIKLLKNDSNLPKMIKNMCDCGGEISFHYDFEINNFYVVDMCSNPAVNNISYNPKKKDIITFHSHPDNVDFVKYPVPSKEDFKGILQSSLLFNHPIYDCIINSNFNYTIYCSNYNFLKYEFSQNDLDEISYIIHNIGHDYIFKHNSIETYNKEFYESNLNEFIDIIPSYNIEQLKHYN